MPQTYPKRALALRVCPNTLDTIGETGASDYELIKILLGEANAGGRGTQTGKPQQVVRPDPSSPTVLTGPPGPREEEAKKNRKERKKRRRK